MHETPADIERLQALLDCSYEGAGAHLRSIITPERRMSARETVERLQGMRMLVLATVTRDGRPIAGPVDGLFYRGEFWFGSSPDSVRFRHIRQRPYVSASHLPSEEFAVTVHGVAHVVDLWAPETAGLRDYCVEIYGEEWKDWVGDAVCARIEADRMFTFKMGGGIDTAS